MQEFQIINQFFKPLTNSNEESKGLKDDTAKISLASDEELVISKDMFVEDVHFLMQDGGFKIASKLLRTNLSDLAASGAKPLYYMLGFSKNDNIEERFIADFAQGLKSVQDEFHLSLIGGDTVASEKLFFSITIFGSVTKGQSLSRSQAKDGDLIYVSGNIGDAFLGRTLKEDDYLMDQHFFPTPRIQLGRQLLKNQLSQCAIDISDGLLVDLERICQSSELTAEIYLQDIPLSEAAIKSLQKNSKIKTLDLLSAGDDYELIFCANPKDQNKIQTLSHSLNLKLTCIGSIKNNSHITPKITLLDKDNQKLIMNKLGYEH